MDNLSTRYAQPDPFGASHRRILAASAALLQANGPRALEQATAELIGAEFRTPELGGLRFDLWGHDLASIGPYGLGGYAAQEAAEAGKSLPPEGLAQQPDWLSLLPDIEATGDVWVLRDDYDTRFVVIAGFTYPGDVGRSVYLLDFDASEHLSLAGAGAFDDAEQAVTACRNATMDSMEPVTPEVLTWLSYGEQIEGLVDELGSRLLNECFRGPRRIQDITTRLGAPADPPRIDPPRTQEAFTAWYSERYGENPDRDAAAALAEEWLEVVLPGTEHAVSPRRSAVFRDQITSWWDEEEADRGLALLPDWIRWRGRAVSWRHSRASGFRVHQPPSGPGPGPGGGVRSGGRRTAGSVVSRRRG